MLRRGRNARWFFTAHAQSALGSGAGYVALLVLAYERGSTPLAVTLVLVADFVPGMLAGPFLGAVVDRWSRKWCAVAADVVRAGAFLGIATVDSIEATAAFALVAGAGTALFLPSVYAALPSIVEDEELPAANALYAAVDDLGWTVGPAIAGVAFLIADAEAVMLVNALTFALSALLLAALRLRGRPAPERSERTPILSSVTAGVRATARMPAIRVILVASGAMMLVSAMINLGELLLATDVLGAGETGFSILVAVYGAGVMAGSLSGARGGDGLVARRRFLLGMLIFGLATLASGLVPAFWVAVLTFTLTGVGEGLNSVYERLLLQREVPDELRGRVFALRLTINSWGFAGALVASGALATALGARGLFLAAGAGVVVVWLLCLQPLNAWGRLHPEPAPRLPPSG
jgi:MFS family permease